MHQKLQQYHNEILNKVNNTSSEIPAHRAAFKEGYSFSNEPFEKQLAIWNHVWKHSGNWRAMIHAYFFLEQYVKKTELHAAIWETSKEWQQQASSWDLCDCLAKINTKALETFPGEVYKQLTLWNKDENPWMRRQSVVSLLYYSRTKKAFLPFSKIAALITPLLTDKEYYVQKGVGWSLRELHNVYPANTLSFLQKHIKSISAIAFTTAIEKIREEEKDVLKKMRK